MQRLDLDNYTPCVSELGNGDQPFIEHQLILK